MFHFGLNYITKMTESLKYIIFYIFVFYSRNEKLGHRAKNTDVSILTYCASVYYLDTVVKLFLKNKLKNHVKNLVFYHKLGIIIINSK